MAPTSYSRKERCEGMIVLKSDPELKTTFERLIQTMKEPVEWNGQFVVIGDFLILHGRVRSLFFNFETGNVFTNLKEIPVKEEEIADAASYTKVQDVLHLTLYAFGKWGRIRGLRVEHDFQKLNALFRGVLGVFGIEADYTVEKFRFYKNGMRMSYEDVVQCAMEAEEAVLEEAQAETETPAGLWHKLVWQKHADAIAKQEISFEERQKNRIGNNFYMVSYLCPKCRAHLHMAVYPHRKEFRIETTEGGVLLARAYVCESCRCFYTPRPEKLLTEGDLFRMDFSHDEQAYEDYLELLGADAARVSNYGFNRYENMQGSRAQSDGTEAGASLALLCEDIGALSNQQLFETSEKIEEGFYPAGSVEQFGNAVRKETEKRKAAFGRPASERGAAAFRQYVKAERKQAEHVKDRAGEGAAEERAVQPTQKKQQTAQEHAGRPKEIPAARREAAKKRYAAKCSVLDRLSEAQTAELARDLMREENLYDADKEPILNAVRKRERQLKRERIKRLSESCQGANYAKMRRVIEEIDKMDLPQEELSSFLKPLRSALKKQGNAEAAALIRDMPKQMSLKQYRDCMERLQTYPEADLAPYADVLEEKRRQAEQKEISEQVGRAKTKDRKSLVNLMERLQSQSYEPEILAPYMQQLQEQLRILDENAIANICGDPKMTAAEVMKAYETIKEGPFLPDLKDNALQMLKKRLEKLKVEECELLVQKLMRDLEGRIAKNDRHHFYPAKRVFRKEAKPEEYETIQYALDTYGTKRDSFEYPILVVDTSRDRSGKEGMILTPEHLFYRTMLSAYVVSIWDIKGVHAQTGLFHNGLFLDLKNGTQVKIPYATARQELVAWGNCLEAFLSYLREKPDSRNVSYLAQGKHATICCFRCGYSYQGGDVCPKCGYKRNQ